MPCLCSVLHQTALVCGVHSALLWGTWPYGVCLVFATFVIRWCWYAVGPLFSFAYMALWRMTCLCNVLHQMALVRISPLIPFSHKALWRMTCLCSILRQRASAFARASVPVWATLPYSITIAWMCGRAMLISATLFIIISADMLTALCFAYT